MSKKTGPVLRSTNLHFDTREEENLDYIAGLMPGVNYRKRYALKAVDVKEREDTITASWWLKYRFTPCAFEYRQYYGRTTRFISGKLKNESWYRNEYVRLVLSFRQELPRLYLIKGKKITDVSNARLFPSALPYDIQIAQEYFLPQLMERYDIPDGANTFGRALSYIRHKWIRDLFQHTGTVPDIPRMTTDKRDEYGALEARFPSPRWSLQELMNIALGEASTRSTRRKMLELMQTNDIGGVLWSARSLNGIAHLFDPSDWAEVLPVARLLGQELVANDEALDTHLFNVLTPQRRMRLVRDVEETPDWVIRDTLYMYYIAVAHHGREPNCDGRTWNEIHDNLSDDRQIAYRQAQAERDKKLAEGTVNQEPYNGIDGVKIGEYQFLTPKKPLELEEWGDTLNHCIGSYAFDALRGDMIFFALTQDNSVVYTGMIRPRTQELSQFRGRHNCEVPAELFASVVKVLIDHDLLSQDHPARERYTY